MALSNYTELRETILRWLNRPELASSVPDWIALAEADLRRDEAVQDEVTTTISLNVSPKALPSDCERVTGLFYNDTNVRGPIDLKAAPELLAQAGAVWSNTGRPRAAAVIDNGTYLALAPEPDQAYTAYITYIRKLEPLATTPTNWLLTNHPDIYLYGALLQSAPFLKNDDRIIVWQAGLEKAKTQLKRQFQLRKTSANTMVVRPRRPIG